MSNRTLILSDLHLGRPRLAAVSAEALRPLWRGCSRVLINGDLAEVHSPAHWAAAARQTLHLHDLCEADGVELMLLSGNHDPYITDVRHMELLEGAVFITHGDVLHPAIAPWSPRAGLLREAHDRAIEAIPPDERDRLDSRLRVSQFASHQEWAQMAEQASMSTVPQMLMRPWRIAQVLWYWHRYPRLAAAFLEKHAPHAVVGLFGHTHRAGIWRLGQRTVINTGAFGFPGRPRAVLVDTQPSRVQVLRVEFDRGSTTYRLAAVPMLVIDLPRVPSNLASGRDRAELAAVTVSTPQP